MINLGKSPFLTGVKAASANPAYITLGEDGWYTFETHSGQFYTANDQSHNNLRSEFITVPRIATVGDVWTMVDILWDGVPPPIWATFMQTHNNGKQNANNPPNPVFNIEAWAGHPNELRVVHRRQDVYPGVTPVTTTLTEFDIVPSEPFRIVTFARMTNGQPGGAAKVWHSGNLIVDYKGPMGYPVSPEDNTGISPHCGVYRGQGPDELATPIVYSVKMKNYYAGHRSLQDQIGEAA